MKAELIDMLCRKSFKFSEEPIYKLVSGRMSQFYVNCKPVTLSAQGIFLAGHLIFEAIKNEDVTGVGGLTFGADPLAVAAAFASELKGKPINAFSMTTELFAGSKAIFSRVSGWPSSMMWPPQAAPQLRPSSGHARKD
jgi:orotate phosphoribosyltransferase